MIHRPTASAVAFLALAVVYCPCALAQPQDAPAPVEAQDLPDTPAAPAEAQPAPTREQWVEQLADPEYALREEATFTLLRDDALDEPALRALLLAEDHPERRRRLLHIAEHHLMRSICAAAADQGQEIVRPPDSGAVGFSYNPIVPESNPHSPNAAIIILATMPGFPGHAYLVPGDLILAIDGRSTRTSAVQGIKRWVGDTIARYRAGDSITLTVFRDEQTIDFEMSCGSITVLNEIYVTTGQGNTIRRPNYQRALDEALARLTAGLPAPEPLVPEE